MRTFFVLPFKSKIKVTLTSILYKSKTCLVCCPPQEKCFEKHDAYVNLNDIRKLARVLFVVISRQGLREQEKYRE